MSLRRVIGAGWPVAAAAVLSLLALVEITRREETSTDVSTLLLLGLGATVPLAFASTHALTAAVTITAASLLTVASGARVSVAGVLALVVVLYLVGLRRAQRVRHHVVARHESRQVAADSVLEYAARGERARIARELHDVVAHHISMISVQAETARLTTPGMPMEGGRRLTAIGDTARTALTEMRRLLGVLREDAGPVATRAPQPGLDQLNELVDEARDSAGVSTRLIVRGRVVPLDPGVELTAFRIVQEALTNARRHAPGAAVDVLLDYADDGLRIRVRDNGPGPPDGARADGHGLVGMRERATMVGGRLWSGPAPVGGFVVHAILPTAGHG